MRDQRYFKRMAAAYLSAMDRAAATAGARENYAMDRGKVEELFIRGHYCLRFTYSPGDEYQDANGATFDATRGAWIN